MTTTSEAAASHDHIPADSSQPGLVAKVLELIKHRGPKYVLVSIVNVLFGGGLLVLFQSHIPPVDANILSVALSSLPAYYMNRMWVWGKRGKSHWKKEVLPFWFFVVAGLVLSTVAIAFAEDHTKNRYLILGTQLSAFGLLWVLRFFLLDKLFHIEINEDDTPDEE
ncbi:MAG: GtrA family protein [Acidimicrobiales bacterium]|nr:GtrA family protein [Acidimicrobiales bacterium]